MQLVPLVIAIAGAGVQIQGISQANQQAKKQESLLQQRLAMEKKRELAHAIQAAETGKAKFAASGVGIGSPTAVDALGSYHAQALGNIRLLEYEARIAQSRIDANRQSAVMSGVGSLLGSVGSAAGAYNAIPGEGFSGKMDTVFS